MHIQSNTKKVEVRPEQGNDIRNKRLTYKPTKRTENIRGFDLEERKNLIIYKLK